MILKLDKHVYQTYNTGWKENLLSYRKSEQIEATKMSIHFIQEAKNVPLCTKELGVMKANVLGVKKLLKL